jgi:hypothetical protein
VLLGHLDGCGSKILQGVLAFVFGVLDDGWTRLAPRPVFDGSHAVHAPISASLANLEVQRTKVLFSRSPDVTGQQRMVLTTPE